MSSGGPLILVGCLALVALGVLWFVSKRREAIEGWQPREFVEYSPRGIQPRRTAQPRVPVQYNNTETWDISWSKDGLPTKVVVHRNATRA